MTMKSLYNCRLRNYSNAVEIFSSSVSSFVEGGDKSRKQDEKYESLHRFIVILIFQYLFMILIRNLLNFSWYILGWKKEVAEGTSMFTPAHFHSILFISYLISNNRKILNPFCRHFTICNSGFPLTMSSASVILDCSSIR